MRRVEDLLKALECSITPASDKTICKGCKYRHLEEVSEEIPLPADVTEDEIRYCETCDVDQMVLDAIEMIKQLSRIAEKKGDN